LCVGPAKLVVGMESPSVCLYWLMTPAVIETAMGGLDNPPEGGFFVAWTRPTAARQVIKNPPRTEWED
jgi:hypothetical protein